MQEIKLRLRVDSVTTQPLDPDSQPTSLIPAFVRGMQCHLVLELLDSSLEALEGLERYTSWHFVLADDWLTETPVQLEVAEGITATGNLITIPLLDTENALLVAALAGKEEITLGGELAGFEEGNQRATFLIQFNLKVRNRRGTTRPGGEIPAFPFAFGAVFNLDGVELAALPVGRYKLASFLTVPGEVAVAAGSVTLHPGETAEGASVLLENNALYLIKEAAPSGEGE